MLFSKEITQEDATACQLSSEDEEAILYLLSRDVVHLYDNRSQKHLDIQQKFGEFVEIRADWIGRGEYYWWRFVRSMQFMTFSYFFLGVALTGLGYRFRKRWLMLLGAVVVIVLSATYVVDGVNRMMRPPTECG